MVKRELGFLKTKSKDDDCAGDSHGGCKDSTL